ncbi:ATP-binding protein [Lacinutrix jangbogonensis]|uniref:ATP-binding protein n=1 Tax=Lacinutrix jangbogonensis TaxID=1469557 RepID=UPI00069001D4|nr:sensor histidine kinase [Lacinutrix jangbogonensis]
MPFLKSKLVCSIVCYCVTFFAFSQSSTIDSIKLYKTQSKQKNDFSNIQRLAFAKRAVYLAKELNTDSLIIQCNRRISTVFWELKDFEAFKLVNLENVTLSEKVKDSSSFARANQNLGIYYVNKRLSDSAYFYQNKAVKTYIALKDKYNAAKTLLDLAVIQKNEKDFTGSEIASTKAIKLLESLEENKAVNSYKSYHYNNLGLVFKQLEQYDESIKYHKKSIEIKKRLAGNNEFFINISKNNLALTYKYADQYNLALAYFKEILNDKTIQTEHLDFYATILDNYAHTLYLSNAKTQLPELYLKALRICDSTKSQYNSIIIHQHLAEFYHDQNKKDSTKYHAYRAKSISEQYHNDDLLKSLLLLSRIEEDSIAVKHYDAYVTLNDSLVKAERTIRNKFIRIEYETDKVEAKNKQLFSQNIWLIVLSIILVFSSLLLYIIKTQREKNKELKLVQQQQEANEEIYNLMLSQQEQMDEARTAEKKRISEELHDGILGRLFGTRLSLDSLNYSTTEEAINNRFNYIDELKEIEQDIRKVSHDLNTDFITQASFSEMINTLIITQCGAYELEYETDISEKINWDDLTNKTKIHIYRIVQESLQNIYKHAKAKLVIVALKQENNFISLIIKDDGVGYDKSKQKEGIGLKNIKSRIEAISGTQEIKSEINKGTTINIEVPIE